MCLESQALAAYGFKEEEMLIQTEGRGDAGVITIALQSLFVDALRLRLEEKETMLNKKTKQIQEMAEEKGTQAGEIHDLKDMLDVKERKVNVLQKKIENLQEQLRDKEKQLSNLKERVKSLQADTTNTDTALTTLEEALAEKERTIERLKEQRDRDEREKQEEIDSNKKDIKDLKEKVSMLQADLSEREASLLDLKEHASSLASSGLKKDSRLKSLEIALEQKKEECLKMDSQLKKHPEVLLSHPSKPILGCSNTDIENVRVISSVAQSHQLLSVHGMEVKYVDCATHIPMENTFMHGRCVIPKALVHGGSGSSESGNWGCCCKRELNSLYGSGVPEALAILPPAWAHEATLEARASPEMSDHFQQLEREVTRYREESTKAQAEVDRLLEILKEMENEKNDKDKKIAELERVDFLNIISYGFNCVVSNARKIT
uniref:Uncharacterized protein n=1 Tax=Sphaerodactylus townsendi TaxID=933632 RepID=A0ACB8FMG8_9SAUR